MSTRNSNQTVAQYFLAFSQRLLFDWICLMTNYWSQLIKKLKILVLQEETTASGTGEHERRELQGAGKITRAKEGTHSKTVGSDKLNCSNEGDKILEVTTCQGWECLIPRAGAFNKEKNRSNFICLDSRDESCERNQIECLLVRCLGRTKTNTSVVSVVPAKHRRNSEAGLWM